MRRQFNLIIGVFVGSVISFAVAPFSGYVISAIVGGTVFGLVFASSLRHQSPDD